LRGDSHLAYPEVRQWVEAQPGLRSVTGVTSNAVLQDLARAVVEQATRAYARWGRKVTRFHSTRDQAQTWSRLRRVVLKVEVSEPGVNTRLVVTDMEQARTKVLYQKIYCARGQTAPITLSNTPLVVRLQVRYCNHAWRLRRSSRLMWLWLSGRVSRRTRWARRHQPARGRAKRQRMVSSAYSRMISPWRARYSSAASATEP
jgi:hypothetical protein